MVVIVLKHADKAHKQDPLPPLRVRPVLARHHRVIALVRLQRQLLQRLELLLAQLLHLGGEHGLRGGGGVDAARLDGDHAVPAVLQEVLRVQAHDARLVRLRHVREDRVHHAHQHAVLQRVPRVLDDRNDVRTRLRHIDQIAPRAVRELHRVHEARLPSQPTKTTHRTHDIGDVRNGRARCSAQIEDLASGLHVDIANTTLRIIHHKHSYDHGSAKLRTERIPLSVLLLLADGSLAMRKGERAYGNVY